MTLLKITASALGAGALFMSAAPAQADCGPIQGYGSGHVYYISPGGADTNTGTSCDSPWPMDKAGDVRQPGDTVAFQGGATFTQSLALQGESGTTAQPIYYASYGTGRATLTGGVWLRSVSYLELTGLDISSSSTPGVHTSPTGTGAADVMLLGDSITSSYDQAVGGYGVAILNPLDTNWTVQGDTIANTADSGVMDHGGGPVSIIASTFANNGVGTHCGPAGTAGVNPCHAIYGKGPDMTVLNNTITNPQTAGISLRFADNDIAGNVISGGQYGVAFSSETTTPGTTYVTGNRTTGQSLVGIEVYPGTQPVYESFVVDANTVSESTGYDVFLKSGPNSATTQTVNLKDNIFQVAAGVTGYLNVAAPLSYTASTYHEHNDTFCGVSPSGSSWYLNGTARTLSTYENWFGAGTEGGSDTVVATC